MNLEDFNVLASRFGASLSAAGTITQTPGMTLPDLPRGTRGGASTGTSAVAGLGTRATGDDERSTGLAGLVG